MENILLIGSGGREHALAWKLSQSEKVKHIFVSPGNAGTCLEDKASNVDLPINDHEMIAQWCSESKIKLVVVGPEAPLAAGLSDVLSLHGIHCFGPSKAAARIESSKEFSKSFMDCHRIPTAKWKSFTDADNAMDYIKEWKGDGLVVKASGLAAGKGVIVADTKEQAMEAALEILELKKFGNAGDTIVVEERLIGEEISVFGFSDGERVFAFPPAQDYKRAYNDDKGPNTGGMGAYAPVPNISDVILEFVGTEVLQKTVDGMKQEGCPFVGLLYAGLMLTEDGPKVLEFNCRFGDPETEALLTLLKSDLYTTMLSCCEGRLIPPVFDWSRKAVTVVLASGGYPNVYKKGVPIQGLAEVKKLEETHMFHAGTKSDTKGTVITSGGRVFALTSTGGSFEEARERAYHAVGCVSFEGMTQRTDIAAKVFKRCGGLSYADSGVDIAAGSSLVEQIKPIALETARSGCMDGLGGFGALFDLRAAGYTDPILVSGTDGVGTKLKVALACKNHRTVGVDLVAMCVNDILAQGAEPLFFLDYYACGKLDTSEAAQVVVGIAEGCKQAGCALLGGETAEMPGMYKASEYDLAGFAVGAVDRACVLPNMDAISAGDCVIGLPSSGVHSNGFSLVRKIVERSGLKYTDQSPFSDKDVSLGEALLEPTKIYVKSILPLMKSGKVKAFAHITGGGLMENIPRVLPPGLSCLLDVHSWSMPKVFGWLYKQGGLTADEMLKTFNCGLGGVLIVESRHAEEVLRQLQCEQALSVGILGHKMQDKPQVQVKGIQTSLEMCFNLPIQRHVKSARMKVACLISGSGTNLQALIDHTLKTDSSAEIRIVISNVPDVKGLERAKKAGIKTQVINHKTFVSRLDFDKAVLTTLQSEGVELVCLAGFMRILTAEFVRHWSGRLINIHPSLLPSFRGMNAHQQALEAGVRISGCTVHYVVEEIDAGGIISQGVVEVKTGDTVETLQERVKEKEWQVYPLAMEMIASGRVRQEEGKVIFS